MFIGGSPGSTAGGIKTTTLVVIILGVIYMLKNKQVNNISVLYIYIISILTRTNNVIHIYTTKAAHSSPMSLSHYSHL